MENKKQRGKSRREEHTGKIANKSRNSENARKTFTGVFDMNPGGFGFIKPDSGGASVYVSEYDTGCAFNKDHVVYEITESVGRFGRPVGRVVHAMDTGDKKIVGTFTKRSRNSYVTPLDNRFVPKIRVLKKNQHNADDGDRVVVSVSRAALREYSESGRDRGYHQAPAEKAVAPDGVITEVLGRADAPGVDVLSILEQSDVPLQFSSDVNALAKLAPAGVSAEELAGRRRVNDIVVTIDNWDTKDIDDAVSLTRDGERFILGVHIADVAHYIREDSELDASALERGTSVYLADRVLPMLPTQYSNGICSLNEGVDRLTLSCVMTINGEGGIESSDIFESVICSQKQMNYPEVSRALETDAQGANNPDGASAAAYEEFIPMLRDMESLCHILRKRRYARGSVDFDLPEAKVTLDENGKPVDIYLDDRGIASHIIEEFMLAANETVARLAAEKGLPFVYRVHEEPDTSKISRLRQFALSLGVGFTKEEKSKFNLPMLMRKIAARNDIAIISKAALRSMQQARYSELNTSHYGLKLSHYCHFTSPIRRYPDLQVHRIIKEYLHGMTDARKKDIAGFLPGLAQKCSYTERRAVNLERQVLRLKMCEYMLDKVGGKFTGVITDIKSFGIIVELPDTTDGVIRRYSMPDEFDFEDGDTSIKGYFTGMELKTGQSVQVILSDVNVDKRTITFEIAPASKRSKVTE